MEPTTVFMGRKGNGRGSGLLEGSLGSFQALGSEGGLYRAIAELLGSGDTLADLLVRTRLEPDEIAPISSMLMRGLRRPGIKRLLGSKKGIALADLPVPLRFVCCFCLSRISQDGAGRFEFVQALTGILAMSPTFGPVRRSRNYRKGDNGSNEED